MQTGLLHVYGLAGGWLRKPRVDQSRPYSWFYSKGPWEKIPFISWKESDFQRGHFPLKALVFLMCTHLLYSTVHL